MEVAPGTVVVVSDIGCPWAHACVHRLLSTRRELGLDGRVVLDHRPFPLELFNRRATPRSILEAEIAVVGGMEPGAGWRMWQAPAHTWPVTTLPAMEAVQAARAQSLAAAEALDRALRLALYAESRCVSLHHVILETARRTDAVDHEALRAALEDGRARHRLFEGLEAARRGAEGSPHLFLPDGGDVHNPGVTKHWVGEPDGGGIPVVDADEPAVYGRLLKRAVGER